MPFVMVVVIQGGRRRQALPDQSDSRNIQTRRRLASQFNTGRVIRGQWVRGEACRIFYLFVAAQLMANCCWTAAGGARFRCDWNRWLAEMSYRLEFIGVAV